MNFESETSLDRTGAASEPPRGGETDAVALRVEGLAVTFKAGKARRRVVEDVSFSIQRGQTLALVGESGSGKSVTSLAVMGLLSPRTSKIDGKISFGDADGKIWQLSELNDRQMQALRGNRIAMIFQEPMTSLNPVQPVGDQISEPLLIHKKMNRSQRAAAAVRMLKKVGIPDPAGRAHAYPHELSGGMRQRVMIAMSLICGPQLLIADEPTTALDVTIQAQILRDLRVLQQEFGMAMLFVTHDLGVVAEIAHSVAVMYAGQIVESGPSEVVLRRPKHPYTKALLASIPSITTDRQQPLTTIPGSVPDTANMPKACRFHARCSHAVAGLCDAVEPKLETIMDGQVVRCLRWREL